MGQLIIIAAMFALLWLLLIRPQRAKQQRQRHLIESVEPGDEILTVGGLYGIVQELDDDEDLVVEIAEGIHARIARRAVASVVKPDDEDTDHDEEDTDHDALEPEDAAAASRLDEGDVTESEDSVRSDAAATTGVQERS